MSKELVNVTNVEMNVPVQKRDGGTYQATRVTYTDGTGRTVVKAIGTEHLSRPENTALAMKLNNLSQQTPKDVVLSTVKNGAFVNITDIQNPSEVDTNELTQKTQTSTTGSTGSGTYKSKGSFGGKSPEERRSIQAQVALKAAVDLAVGRGGSIDEIVQNAKTFNRLLSELVG